ncbi:MAG: VWA domain-containing protein [Actinobacteria bacterium]|nr:VWA domain-containing protein [Actinomycetota bacterium]
MSPGRADDLILVDDLILLKVTRFARRLHRRGASVGPGRVEDACRALAEAGVGSREDLYWVLRCTLVSREEDLSAFDQAFAGFDREEESQQHLLPASDDDEAAVAVREIVDQSEEGDEDEDEDEDAAGRRSSSLERLRQLDFARYSEDDLRQAARLVGEMAKQLPTRRSRRLRAAKDGTVFDKRRTLRAAMRTDGYPVARLWRERRQVPRRLLFVVDISGSMQPYARVMLLLTQAAVQAGRKVEVFTFGTRLTRVTPELRSRDWNRALEAAQQNVVDWAGGTRIGESLQTLHRDWGSKRIANGAVAVILSDGWETGDADLLGREMAWLKRAAHAILWVNPLAGRAGYEPLTAGMAAALPSIDRLLPGGDLRAIEGLTEVLRTLPELGGGRSRTASVGPGRSRSI